MGKTRLGGYFVIHVLLTLFSSESILTWRIVERFFAEFFSFLFDN